FNNNWTTNLGGIPIRWFPASWTLCERKQREKFQAVAYNIPEDITTHTLWRDQKPTTYLCELRVKSFKIVQTGKGKRKLVGYFKTWKAVRKVLDYHQVLSSEGIRLLWCQHSTPNLKKVPTTKDRSGGKKTDSSNAKSKKKDQQSSSKSPNKSNKLKKPLGQKSKDSENSDNLKKKAKGSNNSNKEALYKHEHGALVDTYSDLEDSDDNAKDDDTDIIIESTPITPTPNPVPISQQELSDIVMTPVDLPVTPKISRKEEINNSTRVPMDKQVTNQSKKGNNNNWKKKSLANNSSKPAVTEVLTGYEVSSPEEQGPQIPNP
ncbi:hypothetical protein C1646_765411, partial [Rhizophagus diaphanus]